MVELKHFLLILFKYCRNLKNIPCHLLPKYLILCSKFLLHLVMHEWLHQMIVLDLETTLWIRILHCIRAPNQINENSSGSQTQHFWLNYKKIWGCSGVRIWFHRFQISLHKTRILVKFVFIKPSFWRKGEITPFGIK